MMEHKLQRGWRVPILFKVATANGYLLLHSKIRLLKSSSCFSRNIAGTIIPGGGIGKKNSRFAPAKIIRGLQLSSVFHCRSMPLHLLLVNTPGMAAADFS